VTGLGVSVDINKQEREYKDFTLADENVVRLLIQYRSKYDLLHNANINIDISQAGDEFDFNQELIVMYASLDKVIEQCIESRRFKEKHIKLLELLFDGNTLQDIVAMDIGFKKSATYDLFDRMVARIVEFNKKNWLEVMDKKGFTK